MTNVGKIQNIPNNKKTTVLSTITKINKIVIALLTLILILDVLSIRHETATYDEGTHMTYGKRMLQLKSDKSIEGPMPISCLNMVPYAAGKLLKAIFASNLFLDYLLTLNTARFITILFSLLLALYVFRWSKELYGASAGIFSLILYAFEPNIIAHSRLLSLDLYSACLTTISTYYFWRFVKMGGWKNATKSALLLGVSQLTKYTCIFLYPIFVFIVLVRYSKDILELIKVRNYSDLINYSKSFLKFALFFIAIGIIIVNIGFLFNRSFTPLEKYEFRSNSFKSLQSKLTMLRHIPIPLPYSYLESLDIHKYNEDMGGQQHGLIYLLGKLRKGGGFKGYYFYTYFYKVPIAIQLFIFLSIISYVLKYKEYKFFSNEIFILFPVIFLVIYLNFIFTMHIGIRNFIIVLPLLLIFCGGLLKDYDKSNLKLKIPVIVLVGYLIISVLSYFPHYISYFNEFTWDRKQTYKVLADSNIDWGQNEWYLKKYKDEHPNIYINPERPVAGRIVASVNWLVGIGDPGKSRWLRDNFEPIDHIAYSYLVYDISAKDLKTIK